MKTCTRCALSKRETEFRQKTSGPLAGFIFPVCIQCDGEIHDENVAESLRTRGYTCTKAAAVASEEIK